MGLPRDVETRSVSMRGDKGDRDSVSEFCSVLIRESEELGLSLSRLAIGHS